MRRKLLVGLPFALAAAAIMAGLDYQTGQAQIKKGKDHVAMTKYLMKGVVASHKSSIDGLLKKDTIDDKSWDTVACSASILNEMGYVLMDDGRCPDKVWSDASTAMREASARLLAAAEAKNVDDAKAAYKSVLMSCGACHSAHKKKKA